MKYWFIFCKTDLLLEKKEDGTYTIPFYYSDSCKRSLSLFGTDEKKVL